MPSHVIYPQLDGVRINEDRSLPIALIQGIRKAYDYIVELSGAGLAEDPVQMLYRKQSELAALAASLGTGRANLLVNVTDYNHVLRWTGSGWTWGPGEQGSGRMELFEVDPTGVGWHLYDGAVGVRYLKSDGSLGLVTLPNLAGTAAYTKAGSPNSGPNAAVAPTVTNPANTGSHTLVIAEMPSHNHALGVASNIAVSAGPNPMSSLAANVSNTTATGGDGGHTHPLSNPTAGTNGEPANIVRRPWFRQ